MPQSEDYETLEEYEDAVDSFYDAIETDFEERRLHEIDEDQWDALKDSKTSLELRCTALPSLSLWIGTRWETHDGR